MQPTYMPWAGYFNLMYQVEHFVFLDDVQFEKSSWQNRNRILINGSPHWLTVPVLRQHLSDKIHDIKIDPKTTWRTKQMKLLQQEYRNASHVNEMVELAEKATDVNACFLSELNIGTLAECAAKLGLSKVKFYRASQLGIEGGRSQRLLNICKHLKCDEYVSPPGSREYIEADGVFAGQGDITLSYHEFVPLPYRQIRSAEFVSHMSILDVIANLGWKETQKYISVFCKKMERPYV